MPALSWVIPFKLEVDDRAAVASMVIGGVPYGVYMPSIIFWIETLTAVAFMGMLGALVGAVMYKFIIQKQGTLTSYLIGFGIIIPFWVTFPYYGVEMFDFRNKFMKFCFGVIMPTLGIFHTTEAMYGCAPTHVSSSLAAYAHYCGSPITLQYDQKEKKYIKTTIQDFLSHLKGFSISMFLLGAIQSFAMISHFEPFGSFAGQPWYNLSRLLHPAQFGNNLVVGFIMQGYLFTATEGLITATILLTGYKCEHVMENAIMTATSPSQFWGKRWNRLVHSVLKRGVYIPLRKHSVPRQWAAAGAFLASGIFHEWLLTFVFQPLPFELGPNGECVFPLCYQPSLGGSTAFMLYNAFVIMIEYAVGGTKPVAMFVTHVPTPLRTVALIMLGLPVVHWFCDPYTISNFFDHAAICVPFIKAIE